MRLYINLATQPYEVAQAYARRMMMAIVALAITAGVLLAYIAYQRHNSRGINAKLADAQRQLQGLDREESQARAMLNKPANRVIADQSDFLNQLFARKALSWTRIFTEMEKIVPPGLHVVSMKPEYTKTNDLMLHVVVATDSRDRAVEMVRNMEKSAHLRQAQIVAEAVTTGSSDQAAGGGNIQFDIAAAYVPGVADDASPAPASESGKKEASKPEGAPVKKAVSQPETRPVGNSAPGIVTSASPNATIPRSPNVTMPQSSVTSGSFNMSAGTGAAPGVQGAPVGTANPSQTGGAAANRAARPGRIRGQ